MREDEKLMNLTDEYLSSLDSLQTRFEQMSSEEKKDIYEDLIKVINFHNSLYYIKAQPVISDYQYDKLFDLLKQIERKEPSLIKSDSPTQRINVEVQQQFYQEQHRVPMLSLDNSYNIKDLQDWHDFIERNLKKSGYEKWSYFLEPKFDGSSVELIYLGGKFYKAVTRGDGFVGEDISENVKTISSVPMELEGAENVEEIRIRGEIMIPKEFFRKLNEERERKGLVSFANPRNATAGSLRQLDARVTAERKLVCFVYDVLYISGENLENEDFLAKFLGKFRENIVQEDVLNMFESMGLYVFDWRYVSEDIQEVFQKCQEEDTIGFLENQNIEFDGMVIKINELNLRSLLGETSHHPRWAIAFKFPAQEVTTRIKDVKFNVGRTGVLTPTAQLEPVEVSGVIVSRATLHNFDFIRDKDIRIGDYVWIKRSGEVIPYVIKSIQEKRNQNQTREIYPPSVCPVCGSEVIKFPEEIYYYCSNINCPAVIKEKIIHFASKDGMDIEGLGEKIVDWVVDAGIIFHFADIYRIKQPEIRYKIVSLPGMGYKSVDDLIGEIEKTKYNYLWRILNSLGIRYIGKKTAKFIEDAIYENLKTQKDFEEALKIFDTQELMKFLQDKDFLNGIYGIGEKIVESVYKYISVEENRQIIKELEEVGVEFNVFQSYEEEESSDEKPLKGVRFSITGKFSFTRGEIKEVLEKYGAEFDDQPTQKTTFLLSGTEPGNKLAKAEQRGIEIIQDLNALIQKYPFLEDEFQRSSESLFDL